MTPHTILLIICGYFLLLMVISWLTSKKATNSTFFAADHKSPWYLVAFGMIGASLSGVTFISLPGIVGATPEVMKMLTGEEIVRQNIYFSYMQMVMGYVVGYAVIALLLLPLYYRLKLTSIYQYLGQRFGYYTQKAGAGYFLVSRVIGASFRIYLVAIVLQTFMMDSFGIPFWATILIMISLIWAYTYKGGIKTIIYTDTLQTLFMLIAVVTTIAYIGSSMGQSFTEILTTVKNSEYSKVFFFENGWSDPNFFPKQFFSGALMAIVMTGLDQDMMQKNLTCKSLKEAQWNMGSFVFVLFFVNILFLALGALLYMYSSNIGIALPKSTDQLYPLLALRHFPSYISIIFLIGFVAAAFSSADSALTSLTTSFSTDFLGISTDPDKVKPDDKKKRMISHIGFSLLVMALVILANQYSGGSVLNKLFKFAGYTYGPLLGMFAFGIFTHRQIKDNLVIGVTLAAAILSVILDLNSARLFHGFTFGFFILAVNGLLTFLGLWLISYEPDDIND
ncbi:MAG TPA: sodium:solute symporter [Saprospiraceae bacterium]|nr:sodium:solute symporter [Saprospiraceae bacterium]